MKFRVYQLFFYLLASALLTNCATAPTAGKSSTPTATASNAVTDDPFYIAPGLIDPNAKRFLSSIKTGDLMFNAFNKEIEKSSVSNPGMVEVVHRAFANIKPDDFENIAAKVYTRHMSKPALEDMKNFTEGPVGGRFFRSVFAYIADAKPVDNEAVMRQFNADEITSLLKFTQGDSFTELQKKLPTINQEMSEEGRKFGEAVIKHYLKNAK